MLPRTFDCSPWPSPVRARSTILVSVCTRAIIRSWKVDAAGLAYRKVTRARGFAGRDDNDTSMHSARVTRA